MDSGFFALGEEQFAGDVPDNTSKSVCYLHHLCPLAVLIPGITAHLFVFYSQQNTFPGCTDAIPFLSWRTNVHVESHK